MNEFITLNSIILNRKSIKSCVVKKDVEYCGDLDYKDGMRPTDVYVKITTFDGDEFNETVLDDDWNDFVNFIGQLYNIDDYENKRRLAANILSKSEINETKYPDSDY